MQPNKAIVGANAFAHESRHPPGRHAEARRHLRDHDARDRSASSRSTLVHGQAFRPPRLQDEARRSWAIELGDNALERRLPPLQGAGRQEEGRLRRGHRRAGRRRGRCASNERIRFVALQVIAGSKGAAAAELELEVDGAERSRRRRPATARSTRSSSAISALVPARGAPAAVPGPCGDRGHRRPGRGHRAAGGERQDGQRPGRRHRHAGRLGRAYVHALNKLLTKREKTRPRRCPPSRRCRDRFGAAAAAGQRVRRTGRPACAPSRRSGGIGLEFAALRRYAWRAPTG